MPGSPGPVDGRIDRRWRRGRHERGTADGRSAARADPSGRTRAANRSSGHVSAASCPSAPELGLATATVVVGFAGLTACLLVLGSVAEGVRSQEVFALDTWATPFLHGISSPGMDAAMNAITDLGTIWVILPPLVAVRRMAAAEPATSGPVVFLVVAMLGSLVLQCTMKPFFARPRPAAAVGAGPARLQLPERPHA